jgi:DNA-binding Lrp family transcriptional regulator
LDQIDQKIVALMRADARRSFKDIGDRVSLSAPAVKRRVDRLEREGVIKGYTTTVDHSAFGWHAHAFVELFCEGRMSGVEVREALMQHPEVEGAYTVAGAPSAILHLRAEDNQHLEETLERIRETKGVLRTQAQIVLSTLLERPVIESDGSGPSSGASDTEGSDRGGR